ncbi:MAG: carboxypeptidase regulatory-like domain-containing protein [Planctomycetes bacterium]|nr:carboxypeptidase regulatory-like domain-containing protein [Planctomycetota bacterium]
MKPKTGTDRVPVPPAAPEAAKEADRTDSGLLSKWQALQAQLQAGQTDSAQAKPFKPPDEEQAEDQPAGWIEVELVDMDDRPVPGEAYEITLPDGETVASGTLDEKGLARINGIEPGTCRISFPNLDEEAWEPA